MSVAQEGGDLQHNYGKDIRLNSLLGVSTKPESEAAFHLQRCEVLSNPLIDESPQGWTHIIV